MLTGLVALPFIETNLSAEQNNSISHQKSNNYKPNNHNHAKTPNCDNLNAKNCANLAFKFLNGTDGIVKDIPAAKSLLKKSCNNNYANACNDLGIIYQQGLGAQPDYKQAVHYLKKSCDLKYLNGCRNLKKYQQHIVKKLSHNCTDNNDKIACYNVGILSLKGAGLPRNEVIAKQHFNKACNLGQIKGCRMVANTTMGKSFNVSNIIKARNLYRNLCHKHNDATSCHWYEKLKKIDTSF